MCLYFLQTFRLYGKLNRLEIPVNRGSTNSCDDNSTSAVAVPHIYLIDFVPKIITEEIHREASKLLNKKGRIAVGSDGSNICYCHNKKNIRLPVAVGYDTRVNDQVVTCHSKSCVRYRSFNICCHTVAMANKFNVLSTPISKLNAKWTTEQALMNSANISRGKNCGKKKTKATQKRKEPCSNKPQKIAKLLPFPDRGELELSQPPSTSRRHANTASAKLDLQQFFNCPNTFLQLPPSKNPVIDSSTRARDLKDSFQFARKTSQFGYPIPPNDMIVVSKTHRHYTDPKTHQKAISTDFSNVYYHFHQARLSRHSHHNY